MPDDNSNDDGSLDENHDTPRTVGYSRSVAWYVFGCLIGLLALFAFIYRIVRDFFKAAG